MTICAGPLDQDVLETASGLNVPADDQATPWSAWGLGAEPDRCILRPYRGNAIAVIVPADLDIGIRGYEDRRAWLDREVGSRATERRALDDVHGAGPGAAETIRHARCRG